MPGLVDYGSDDSEEQGEVAATTTAAAPPVKAPPVKAPPVKAPPAKAPSDARPATPAKASAPPRIHAKKVAEIKKELVLAKSATSVVQVVRNSMDQWDRRWGAHALYSIAKRSTARTRQEWAVDRAVVRVANKLKTESAADALPTGRMDDEDAEVILLSLEALRRMALQGKEEQRPPLEAFLKRFEAAKWKYPVKTLSRFYWLSAPLKLQGVEAVPPELRPRAIELGGVELSLIVEAMRQQGARDLALLEKVIGRLKEKDIHKNLSATDLVELAEGLAELEQRDEAALRPLGQELQRRRGELTPDEAHRIQNAFQTLKLPLSQVWAPPGATKKRDGSAIVTTQAFVPQEGHEKKRRGNNDVERTSPPRVVRDYKMCSY